MDPRFRTMKEHTAAKEQLLSLYVNAYFQILGHAGSFPKVSGFDLFCGPGAYGDGKYGSPIIFLRAIEDAAQTLHNAGRAIPELSLYVNDKDPENITRLRQAVKELFPKKRSTAYSFTEDYKEFLPKVIKLAGEEDRKSFVFLDPFGYSDISILDIRLLLENGNTEVLLWLPMSHMKRFSVKETPEALRRLQDELEITVDDFGATMSHREYIQLFVRKMKPALQRQFVDSFFIKASPTTYHAMFFFTSHVRGAEKLLEAKWKIDADSGEGWDHKQTGGLFGSDLKINDLERILRTKESSPIISGCTNVDLYHWSIRQGYLPRHTKEILKTLIRDGLTVTTINTNKPARKGTFYISYNHSKEAPKLTLKF